MLVFDRAVRGVLRAVPRGAVHAVLRGARLRPFFADASPAELPAYRTSFRVATIRADSRAGRCGFEGDWRETDPTPDVSRHSPNCLRARDSSRGPFRSLGAYRGNRQNS